MHKRGVFTVLDYVSKPEAWVKALWGKIGVELWHELRGEMVYKLDTEAKTSYDSISKTKTFTPPSNDYDYVKAQLFRNTESAFIKLRRYHLRAKRMSVYLRRQDFRGSALEGDLSYGTISPLEAFPLIEEMLKAVFKPGTLYRTTGIILSHLEEDRGLQFELFEDPVRMVAMRRLAESIDEINSTYGKHTMFSATGLYLGWNARKNRLETNERHVLPERKRELLADETYRQRLIIPLWQVKV